jgi:hypothetical protein
LMAPPLDQQQTSSSHSNERTAIGRANTIVIV